jgi:adenosine deaminase
MREAEPDWFDQVPKVELHLHLEGAISLDALWELVLKYGGDASIPDLDALKRRFIYQDFPHFIETWRWKNKFIREYQDFAFIAEAVARDLARQNIFYVEAFYSPSGFEQFGLEIQELTEAIRAGLSRVSGIDVALVADLVRDDGPEKAAVTLAAVSEVQSLGVVGIGIGGSEQRFPPEPFQPVYEEARRLGFHTSAHAGEAAGAASIWGAVRDLQVERIGHGTRAEEDERLMDYLAESQLPLEVCPLSNVRTGVVASIEAHPVRRFFDRGLYITISTDDPKMFGNSLADEYRMLETHLGFSRQKLRTLILQGIRAAWLSAEKKQELVDAFVHTPAWQAEIDEVESPTVDGR